MLVEAGATERGWFAALFSVFCVVLIFLLRMCWFNTPYRTQVYFPPLYRKQEEMRQKQMPVMRAVSSPRDF